MAQKLLNSDLAELISKMKLAQQYVMTRWVHTQPGTQPVETKTKVLLGFSHAEQVTNIFQSVCSDNE